MKIPFISKFDRPHRLQAPLIVKLLAALVAIGLLPLGIAFLQLENQKDALLEQVLRTHTVAATTAAARLDAYLGNLDTVADALAEHPALVRDPRSAAGQQWLRSTLQSNPQVFSVGLFDPAGDTVVLARRSEMAAELPAVPPQTAQPLALIEGATKTWLRLVRPVAASGIRLELVASIEPIQETLADYHLGEQARLGLTQGDSVLLGDVDQLPGSIVADSRIGQLSGARRLSTDSDSGGDQNGQDRIVAFAGLERAPWLVISQQPATVAEVARSHIRAATRKSAILALGLACLIALIAYTTVLAPLRRLATAQRRLAGSNEPASGSEISQLEESFRALQQRITDRQQLDQIFVGRYQIHEMIGMGAMGSVFSAYDPKLRRPLALKTIRVDSEDVNRKAQIRSLLDEAVFAARIQHPNIVTVYDVAQSESAAFVAMEFVEGINLQDLVSQKSPIAISQTVALGGALARGLAAAHARGLVHHDVKPANILLGNDGSIKLTDFGVSQLITSHQPDEVVVCGTPGYLAPECFLGEAYTPAADLFALGVVLYRVLTHQKPFSGGTVRETIARTLTGKFSELRELRPDCPQTLNDLVSGLLARHPEDRPESAQDVAQTLDALAAAMGAQWQVDFPTSAEATAEKSHLRTRSMTIDTVMTAPSSSGPINAPA